MITNVFNNEYTSIMNNTMNAAQLQRKFDYKPTLVLKLLVY